MVFPVRSTSLLDHFSAPVSYTHLKPRRLRQKTQIRPQSREDKSDSIAQDRYAAALGGLDFLLSLKFHREC